MLLGHAFGSLIDRFGKAIYLFCLMVALANIFSEMEFGIFSFSRSIYSILLTVNYLGLSGLIVTDFLENEEKENIIFNSVLFLKIILSIISLIIVSLWSFIYKNEFYIIILLIQLPILFVFNDVFDYYNQAKMRGEKSAVARVFSLFASFTWIMTCYLIGFEFKFYLFAFVIEAFVLAMAHVFLLKDASVQISFKFFNFDYIKLILFSALPLFISGVFAQANLKIDQLMIESILGVEQVAIYAVSVNLVEPLGLISLVLMNILFPLIMKERNKEQRIVSFYHAQKVVTAVSIFLAIILYFGAETILNLLYGDKFYESLKVLHIHVFTLIFVFWSQVYFKWVFANKIYKFTLISHGSGALINILLNYFWLRKFGIIGASYSTLISYFISFSFILLFYKKTRALFFIQVKSLFRLDEYRGVLNWIKAHK